MQHFIHSLHFMLYLCFCNIFKEKKHKFRDHRKDSDLILSGKSDEDKLES